MAKATVKEKIVVAMSGGVDSSVVAALLKRQGFDVFGVHVKIWSDPSVPCLTKVDRHDAMRVAAKLDIPFETWDFTKEYKRAVVEYMIREYAAGRTPNPDVMCNSRIKFGVFLQRALEAGADYIATGHYTRLMRKSQNTNSKSQTNHKTQIPNHKLLTAVDKNKDQSYFLWTLTQDQLKHCLFPIGDHTKPEVRDLARKFGLPTAEKKDSQGICFMGEIEVREFLKKFILTRRGLIKSTSGKVIGEHDGLSFYTIGERHGLGIGGGIPYYVADKEFETNTLIVAEGPYDEKLFSSELIAREVNWISGKEPRLPLRCRARIRYRQPLQLCWVGRISANDKRIYANRESKTFDPRTFVIRENSSLNSCGIRVRFEEAQRAVTPGQSVVFYRGEPFGQAQGREMLGGGIIA